MKILDNLPDTTAPTAARPDGAVKDVSSPGAGDGTPFRADWHNDHYYGLLAVMEAAGISADDSDEEFAAGVGSQFLDAIKILTLVDVQAHSINFTLTDADLLSWHTYLEVTTGASTIAGALPSPSAANNGKKVTFYKTDSGAGKITASGTFQFLGISQGTFDVENQDTGFSAISNGSEWIMERGIGLEIFDISGTLEAIYTKLFLGTTDGDATTNVTHGVDFDKIINITSIVKTGTTYAVYDYRTAETTSQYLLTFTSTDIILSSVGAGLQSENYRIKMKYFI